MHIHKIDVRFRNTFVCHDCDATQLGDTERAQFNTLEDFANLAKSCPPSSYSMPVGWSYNGQFKCPACVATNPGKRWEHA